MAIPHPRDIQLAVVNWLDDRYPFTKAVDEALYQRVPNFANAFYYCFGGMVFILLLSLTGYLLPWDNKAYFATQVTIKIGGLTPPPQLGALIREILQGGAVVGPATLQRFFTIHVFLLPALIVLLMYVHFRFIRAHGISEPM